MNIERKSKEELKIEEVSPRVAFFIHTLFKNPQAYLRINKERYGLSDLGVRHYTEEISNVFEKHQERVLNNPQIEIKAEAYRKEAFANSEGTIIVPLSEEEVKSFTNFLTKNTTLTPFLVRMVSTSIII